MVNLKKSISSSIRNTKNKVQNGVQKFKEDFSKAKSEPRSKRKSLGLGFATVLGIFGVTLLVPVLPAIAKDLPKEGAKPNQVAPVPNQKPALAPSQQILTGLSGAAASICALAIGSGSFLIGGVCGVIVVVGILKAQGR